MRALSNITGGGPKVAIHTVAPGDTLWKLQQTYAVPIQTLKQQNGLESDLLVPGLNLYIPDSAPPERFYQMKSGDTLWVLAQRFATNVQAIMAGNPGLDPNQMQAGQHIRIPTYQRYSIESLAFLDMGDPAPYETILATAARQLTYIAVFTYSGRPDGTLTEVNDAGVIPLCRKVGILPLMVVSNFTTKGFDPDLADQVLNAKNRTAFVKNIASTARAKGYEGVSIDFEFVRPARRNDFTLFLQELKEAIGNKILHINLHAKTKDDPENKLTGFLDYQKIGSICDVVAVMTLDYGYASGPPAPIAPPWWISQVLNFTTGQINRRKVMMAMPHYGYDWTVPTQQGKTAQGIQIKSAINKAITNGVPIQFDSKAQAPWYTYNQGSQQRVIWFEDTKSLIRKYELMQVYGLLGATFWRLRYDFPQNFAYMEKNFNIID